MTLPVSLVLTLVALLITAGYLMSRMPGQSYRGPLEPLTMTESARRDRLQSHVEALAKRIGERNLWQPDRLEAAAAYIEAEFQALGLEPRAIGYSLSGKTVRNIEVLIPGSSGSGQSIVVGAHYDTVPGSPGANDNASGVAALLELGRIFKNSQPKTSLRLVAFVNEEPPFFKTERMGSRVYARQLAAEQVRVTGMLALETIGYYTEQPGSQSFPLPLLRLFYPTRGDFLAFVGNPSSRKLLRRSLKSFRNAGMFPAEGLVAPGSLPGVDWSDHWAFWQQDWPAIMITDTALYRDPQYHAAGDTPERLDYPAMARVVTGLEAVLRELLGP